MNDALIQAVEVRPPRSAYWEFLAEQIRLALETDGDARFKQTVARHYFTGIQKVGRSEEAYTHLLYDHVRALGAPILDEPRDGEPVGCEIDGRFITQDMLHSAVEYLDLQASIDLSTCRTVVEIGGGYGRTAWYLKTLYPHLAYCIVDIPPVLDLAQRYLRVHSPSVQCMPPSDLEAIPDQSVDLILAIDCLREMGRPLVEDYLRVSARIGRHFYCTASEETPIAIPFESDAGPMDAWGIPDAWRLVREARPLIPPGYLTRMYAL